MERHVRTVRLRPDGYTQFCLTAIVVLMTVMIVGLWAERVPLPDKAGAAEPNDRTVERYQPRSVLELGELVRAQERTIDKLDEIKRLLESGSIKVQLVEGSVKDNGGESHAEPTTESSDSTGGLQQGIHAN